MISIFMPSFTSFLYLNDKKGRIAKADLELSIELNHLLSQWVALPKRAGNDHPEPSQEDHWFIAWGVGKNYFETSDNAPDLSFTNKLESTPLYTWENTPQGNYRVLYHYGPRRNTIYAVGTPAEPINDYIHNRFTLSIIFGITLGSIAIYGGYRSSKKALKPIDDISAKAALISQGHYDQRIDTSEVKTELVELSEILNNAFQHIDDTLEIQRKFTSDASHELRTPISILILELESALRKDRSSEEYRERIETSLSAAKRLKDLANSLLEISQIESGEDQLEKQSTNIAELIQAVEQQMLLSAKEKGVQLHNNVGPHSIDLDSQKVTRVITNLLSNALIHTDEGGRITLESEVEDGSLVLRVIDTGSGIPADELPYIFDRFYRADKARTSSQNRSGLGLAISQSIVHAHDGEITIVSTEAVGTKVTLTLPLQS